MGIIFSNAGLTCCLTSVSSLRGSGLHATSKVPAGPQRLRICGWGWRQRVLTWALHSQLENIRCKMHRSLFFSSPQNHYDSCCLPHRDGMKTSVVATKHLKNLPGNVIYVLNIKLQQLPFKNPTTVIPVNQEISPLL